MTSPSAPTAAVVHFPSGGHIRPMLPLAAALRSDGMRVIQWAPAEWEQACLTASGEFRALPDLSDLAWPRPEPVRIAEFLGGLCERLAPWMSEQLEDAGADVVVRDSFASYGHYAALVNGIEDFVVPPMMAFHSGMWPRPSGVRAFAETRSATRRLRECSERCEARYGKPLGDPLDVFAGRHGATTFVLTAASLQLDPARLNGEDVRYLGPLRALGPDEGGQEPALAGVREGEQVVFVSLGTVFEDRPGFFRDAAAALAAPGRRVILSIGRLDPAALGPLPDGVSAHAHVDQLAVLRRADLFVTHAGFNGVQEGLAAGVPLLMCPLMFEQELNAEVVAEHGAGLVCEQSAESIGAGAARLLGEPSYRAAARRLAAELQASNRVDEGVELVAGAARTHAGQACEPAVEP